MLKRIYSPTHFFFIDCFTLQPIKSKVMKNRKFTNSLLKFPFYGNM